MKDDGHRQSSMQRRRARTNISAGRRRRLLRQCKMGTTRRPPLRGRIIWGQFVVLLLVGAAMPDSRHKLRNAGQVFATNGETKSSAGEIRLKQVCGTS